MKNLLILFLLALNINANDKLSIIYTTDLEGSVTPCACAVDPGGGIERRINWYSKLNKENLIYLNSGSTLFPNTPSVKEEEEYLKYGAELLVKSLKEMKITAYTPNLNDFKMGLDFFIEKTKDVPVLISNSKNKEFKKEIILEKPYKIRILGIVSENEFKNIKELEITSYKKFIKNIKKKDNEILILLADLTINELELLKKEKLNIDIIISSNNNEEMMDLVNNTLILSNLNLGDSISILNYTHKEKTKKVDLDKNKELEKQLKDLELLLKTFPDKKKEILEKKKEIEKEFIKDLSKYSQYENQTIFLGEEYKLENDFSELIKKYLELRKTPDIFEF